MKKVFYANIFFVILVMIQIFGAYTLRPIVKLLHLNLASTLVTTQILFLIIPIIIYLVVTKQSPINALRIKPLKIKDLPFVIIIGFAALPIAYFLGLITNLVFHNNVGDVLSKMSSLPLGVMIMVVAMTPAVCEELTMRGVILSGYKKVSIHKAAVTTGLLFGILHLNPSQFLYTFVLGIILAYVVDATESIFSSMICHFIFNGINVLSAWATMKNGAKPQDVKDLAPAIRNSALITLFIISIISIAVIILIIRKLKENNKAIIELQNNIYDNIENNNEHKIGIITAASPVIASIIIYVIFVFSNYI